MSPEDLLIESSEYDGKNTMRSYAFAYINFFGWRGRAYLVAEPEITSSETGPVISNSNEEKSHYVQNEWADGAHVAV